MTSHDSYHVPRASPRDIGATREESCSFSRTRASPVATRPPIARVRRRIVPKRASASTTHRSRSLPRHRVVEFGTKIIMNFHTHRLKNEPSRRARVSPRLGVETRGRGLDAATSRVVIRHIFSHLNLARVRDRARARTSAPARRATGLARCVLRDETSMPLVFTGPERARARRARARGRGEYSRTPSARARPSPPFDGRRHARSSHPARRPRGRLTRLRRSPSMISSSRSTSSRVSDSRRLVETIPFASS